MQKFPVVAILGARQVGKTTLLRELRPQAPFFDLERSEDFSRISRSPEFFSRLPRFALALMNHFNNLQKRETLPLIAQCINTKKV